MPVLRRIMWSDGQPSRDAKDFSVMDDDRAVGRIYRTTNPRGEGYAWFIHGSSRHGFAPTREERRMESGHRWQSGPPLSSVKLVLGPRDNALILGPNAA
jgi:hypothetical protein